MTDLIQKYYPSYRWFRNELGSTYPKNEDYPSYRWFRNEVLEIVNLNAYYPSYRWFRNAVVTKETLGLDYL